MFRLSSNLKEQYSPLYFLASLGPGGLAVSFFMYLLFMTPHQGYPIPTFDTLSVFMADSKLWVTILIFIVMSLIVLFSLLHLRLLFWNIREYLQFKKTTEYKKLISSNAEVQLMAIPLTFAMTINVLFIIGAIFIPNLWQIVEYLFPFAIFAFVITGYYAAHIFLEYSARVLSKGDFDTTKNNNLSQMLGVFAFSMVGVGFSAAAAMSHNQITVGIAIILATVFVTVTIVSGVVKMVLGFHSMLEHGVDKEASVSLWILVPIMTLLGITIYRLSMGMHHNFSTHIDSISHLILFTVIVSIQLIFASIGYAVMKRMNYFDSFVHGEEKSPISYALICPGVAGVVMGFFFLHKGLVEIGIFSQYSVIYWVFLAILIFLQFKTINILFKLNNKLLKPST